MRDPCAAPDHDADASDESDAEMEADAEGGTVGDCETQHTSHDDNQLNQFETPLGLDPTNAPDVVQHLVAFKTQIQLAAKAQQRARADPDAESVEAATARAAAEEECYRAVVDLKAAAGKLNNIQFQKQAAYMDRVSKALLVPSGKALSMFDPATWTKCFSEFWFGDCLPNDTDRPQPITFERLFECLQDREELEYQLDSDNAVYHASTQSRFDTPEFMIVTVRPSRGSGYLVPTAPALQIYAVQCDHNATIPR